VILAFDIGTSVLKGGLIDFNGVLRSRAEVPVHLADRDDPLMHEADANNWVSALALVTAQLQISEMRTGFAGRSDTAARTGGIAAVVVSGNGPTLVPVGAKGEPLDFAMTWMDRRGVEEARLIVETTGQYVDPTFYLPKALWIYRNKPDVYRRTRHFCTCPEFIDLYLTGEACTVLPSEKFTPYIWTPEIIEKLGMDPAKFPPFIKPGELVGRVRLQAEELLGIPAGTPVYAGGPDFLMTLLGTATVRPGRACDRAGTSEGINLCSEHPIEDDRLLCLPHIIEGYTNISGIISTSGRALAWFKSITGRENLDYESLFEDICQVPPGSRSLLFLPYLAGERAPIWDPFARGAFVGLTANHGRKEMTRAVVEAVGFAVRDVIEVMGEHGLQIRELRITGGQARSPLWNQIKADITQKKILVPEVQDAELLGAACIGLFASGNFKNLRQASENVVRIGRTFTPNPEHRELYDRLFRLYRAAYHGLKGVFSDLADIPLEEEP
jgi:xylulokinase